jgi:hypothetical protein
MKPAKKERLISLDVHHPLSPVMGARQAKRLYTREGRKERNMKALLLIPIALSNPTNTFPILPLAAALLSHALR